MFPYPAAGLELRPLGPISLPSPPLSKSLQNSLHSEHLSDSVVTWDRTIERVVKGIVSIKTSVARSFDTDTAGCYTATGFVVDKLRGIILSNRHVLTCAPITATGVFVNYEEVNLRPIYRDPIHDFGFFQFDTDKVKFLEMEQIELRPDLAKIGTSIKVVGNDCGEKLSILGSTLARTDRAAPRYGDDTYEDFNTFYYQAATGTSGGSSGSPVLDISGHAIALNAGGSTRSASSFYLPLDRVVRALRCIQAGTIVSRGTLQTEFVHSSYDELRRLGLTNEAETACRQYDSSVTGLLIVKRVLPSGPALDQLEPGDILISCNRERIFDFVSLWNIIDQSVDKKVELVFYRGSQSFTVSLTVQDLHSITPNRYLEFGGGIFHNLSYQQARHYGMPVENQGVFVASSGMFDWNSSSRNYLITSVDGKPTPNLDEFISVVTVLPDYKYISCRFKDLGNMPESLVHTQIDRHFFEAAVYQRNDVTGIWDCWKIDGPQSTDYICRAPRDVTVEADFSDEYDEQDSEEIVDSELSNLRRDLESSLVYVKSRIPFSISGYSACSSSEGAGVVVSLENNFPIIVCDRIAVPTEAADIRITIQYHAVRGRVIAMERFAFLTFDLADLPAEIKIKAVSFEEEASNTKIGDKIEVLGLISDQSLVAKATEVTELSWANSTKFQPPRFRLSNAEIICLADSFNCVGGVLISQQVTKDNDKKTISYKVFGLLTVMASPSSTKDETRWKAGIDYNLYVRPVVDQLSKLRASAIARNLDSPLQGIKSMGRISPYRTFNVDLDEIPLSQVAAEGVSARRIQRLIKLSKKRTNSSKTASILYVRKKFPHYDLETNDSNDLKPGDIILEIEQKPIVTPSDLEPYLRNAAKASFKFLVFRHGVETLVDVRPFDYGTNCSSIGRIIEWSGMFLHDGIPEAIEQVVPDSSHIPLTQGVYVGSITYGSPSSNTVSAAQWIIQVDNEPVHCIDDLLAILSQHRWQDGDFVRIKQVNRRDVTNVLSIKVNEQYFPTRLLDRTMDGSWESVRI
ncbi:uncharacterized protein V1516DRAFT_619429 [Lipomyces oligophaga]|uniref:uncharacterized protein n=1 Tax=Lipomyces oligophaga TaxID=45792 RepID=UPI0034CF86C7